MFLRRAILVCVIWPAVCSSASTDDSEVLTAVVADICGGDLSSKYLVPDTLQQFLKVQTLAPRSRTRSKSATNSGPDFLPILISSACD